MEFLKDFDFEKLKYSYYLNDIYRMIITIKIDKNILEYINITIKNGYKKICHVEIDNSDYKNGSAEGYFWSLECKTKKPGSGLIDLILWIVLYIFRKYQLRDLVNPKNLYTMEWAKRNNTYIVLHNLLKKSEYYKDLKYEKQVESLNNENLWYYEKYNFKYKDKKRLIKWFLNLEKENEEEKDIDFETLYEHEDFIETVAKWQPLSLKQLKTNIQKAEDNLVFDYI